MDKKILTIIVSYNALRYNWLYSCIDSIKNSTYPTDVFFIDNGSNDASCDVIKSYNEKRFILYEATKNLGFGQANNIGLQYALKHNYDYVFLLNQDAYLEPDTIEKLLQLDLTGYGIISPLQCNGNGSGIDEDFLEFLGPRQSPDFLSDGLISGFKDKIYDCNFVMAAAWFMPIETVKKIGGFSPFFYHYGEDENYCHRVLYHQLKIGIYPKSKIYHDRFKSQGKFFNPVEGPYRHHVIRILNPLLSNYRFRSKLHITVHYIIAVLLKKPNEKKVFSRLYRFLQNKKEIEGHLKMTKSGNENLYLNI